MAADAKSTSGGLRDFVLGRRMTEITARCGQAAMGQRKTASRFEMPWPRSLPIVIF
jgi:hypothetical protein